MSESPEHWPAWVQWIIAGGVGTVTTAVLGFADRIFGLRKSRVETRVAEDAANKNLFEEVASLRARVIAAEDRADQAEQDKRQLQKRIGRLEAALPLAIAAERLQDIELLGDLLDLVTDAMIVTSPSNGGTFLYPNQAFCDLFGWTREEVIRLNWRGLVHPDDVALTQAAEASAWDRNVWNFSNRLRCASGAYLRVLWYAPRYKNGGTVALVKASPNVSVADAAPAPRIPIARQDVRT